LLSSGFSRENHQSRAARAEFPFIAKPYRPTTLALKLKEALLGVSVGRAGYGAETNSIA
jgi:hypothetical protein